MSPDRRLAATATARRPPRRHPRTQHPPLRDDPADFFAVEYAINPWMDTSTPVDAAAPMTQWETLRETYLRLGPHRRRRRAVPGLPDMVYAANGGLIVERHRCRRPLQIPATRRRVDRLRRLDDAAAAITPASTRHVNEGQGDLLRRRPDDLGGHGFRTDIGAHAEVAEFTGCRSSPCELVDPRFYHLDTALAVLDDTTIAYYPPAFTDASQGDAARLFPDGHRGRPAPTPTCWPQRRVRRPARRTSLPPQPVSPNSSATPASSRSASTSRSCSRAAGPSNAARWRFTHDHGGITP